MPLSQITRSFVKHPLDRLCQGDIFRDLTIVTHKRVTGGNDEIILFEYQIPYCILISQDCDLEHDKNNRTNSAATKQDKYLDQLLLLPAYVAEQLRYGKHYRDYEEDVSRIMESYNAERWRLITGNQNSRYHFVKGHLDLQLPDLVVDFKHYTTIGRDQLYEQATESYRCTISALFREDLSHRFTHYLSRVALPVLPDPVPLTQNN